MVNRPKYKPLSFENIVESVDTLGIANSVSYISRFILALSGKEDTIKLLGNAAELINSFISSFGKMVSSYDKKNTKEQNTQKPNQDAKPETSKELTRINKESLISSYLDFVKIHEATDTTEDTKDDNEPQNKNTGLSVINKNNTDVQETEDADVIDDPDEEQKQISGPIVVKDAWFRHFKEGEQDKWILIDKKAIEETKNSVEKSKPQIDVKKENNKDKIIQIANLFEKAYRCYTTATIPSGRPDGRISNTTYLDYTYLGKGERPYNNGSKGPGPVQWASKKVFERFVDKITELLENKEYRKIFNVGTILRTDGQTMEGNVLLEFIRNMIDETELKSYSVNRSRLLNKYFGIRSSTKQAKDEERETPEEVNTAIKIGWEKLTSIKTATDVKVGNFIAITGKTRGGSSETLIGHILKIEGDMILMKYQNNNESIPEVYGKRIYNTRQWFPNSKKTDDVYFGLLKLPIIEGKEFKIIRVSYISKDGKNFEVKPDKLNKTGYVTIFFTPQNIKEVKTGDLARASKRIPIAVLGYDKDGDSFRVKIDKFAINGTSPIHNDIPIDANGVGGVDNIFTNLKSKM